MPYARAYMRYILLGAPFMASSLMLNNILRYQGSSFYGMIGMVSGALINVGLDPLFIFVFGMGTGGAALATLLSQMVSFVLLLYGCTRGGNVRINVRNFSPEFRFYREILRGGFPSLCRQGLAGAAAICVNQRAGVFGDAAIAAISIVHRVAMFALAGFTGIGQGFQPVCGFNYGAKRYDRVRAAFWFCFKVMSVPLLLLAALGAVFAPGIISIFRVNDPEVLRQGTLSLRLQCISVPFMGWITLCSMMLQTTGKAVPASVLAAARQGLFLLPLLFILTPAFGLFGIQLSQPCADIGAFLLALPFGLHALGQMKKAAVIEGEAVSAQYE
jgi:putative MATE family efflux protein